MNATEKIYSFYSTSEKHPVQAGKAEIENIQLKQGTITAVQESGIYSIDFSQEACRATSCLLRPQTGDKVLYSATDGDHAYILHILAREAASSAQLDIPEAGKLLIRAKNLGFLAEEKMDLSSLGDITLSSCFGTLLINTQNLFKTVSDNLVENIQYQISKVSQYALTVKQLLRLHGKQQIVTADQDIKIDAERINMG